MVHVGNAEGHRKMLAFQSPSPSSTSNSTSSSASSQNNHNLSHILINTITRKFGSNEDNLTLNDSTTTNTVLLKNNQNATVGPILPTYKSGSLNLSCIIEEEPPPGMMMSTIRENSNELPQDPNANLSSIIISDPNLNSASSSSSTTTTITTTTTTTGVSGHGNPNESSTVIFTEKVTTTKVSSSGSGGSKKRNSSGESPTFTTTPEKVSQSPHHHLLYHESSDPKEGTAHDKSKHHHHHHRDQVEEGHIPQTHFSPSSSQVSPPQSHKNGGNANNPEQPNNVGGPFTSIPAEPVPNPLPGVEDGSLKGGVAVVEIGESKNSPPQSAVHLQKHGKGSNGTKNVCLKRVSFGSSKGSMVETVIFESSQSEEPHEPKTASTTTNGISSPDVLNVAANGGGNENDSIDSPTTTGAGGGSTGGSRPPSRVRVTFFESEKPLAVSSPESDGVDFDISHTTMTSHHQSPLDASTPNTYSRHLSVESGWDNPFRPDGDLSKEADQIVELIKEGKPINDETLRSISPSVNGEMVMHTSNYTNNLLASPPQGGKGTNGSAANGMEVQRGVVVPPSQTGAVEHVTLNKKKGCCVIQ